VAEDPLSIAVEFGRRLEAATIPYAIGGALALGVHGVVRATSDVDLNVFVEAPRLDEVFAVLSSAGVTVAREQARDEALRDGVFFCWAGPVRVDVFLPSIELSWEAMRTRVRVKVGDQEAWFLSPELLACFKLLFFRPRDLLDLERLVATNVQLDTTRVRSLMVDAMGEDDERVRAWDDAVKRFAP
jgi:hypothetical protein